MRKIVPFLGIALFVAAWQIAVWATHASLVPGPVAAFIAIGELARRGLLIKYIVASLFRVTWGYFGAVIIGIPAGMALRLWPAGEQALNPFLQILRPISQAA